MEQEREVIVVGAGPGGATTAIILAQQGHDVLLIDRHTFPRDKTCGDAIPGGAVDSLYHLGMKEKIEQATTRGEFYPVTGMRLFSPRGYMLQAKFQRSKEGADSYVAPRVYFDAVLQQYAVECGAEFCQAQVKEPIIENGRVVGVRLRSNGRSQEIHSKIVIGADGVTSSIARALRPKEEQHQDIHRAVAIRAYIDDLEEFPQEVEFYLYKGITPGYAWIFPTGENQANIGLGMRLDQFRKRKQSLEEMLRFFMGLPTIKSRLKRGGQLRDIASWQLSFGSQANLHYAFDGALLVGDAAGFINPLTGGGIHNAIISAELAAQTAHEALQRGDSSRRTLQIYEQRCHDSMWEGMRRSFLLNHWIVRYPLLIDFLVRWMKADSHLAQTFLTKL